MADALSPGTRVTQRRKGPVVFRNIATSVGMYLLYAAEGPVGKPVPVTGDDSARAVFGGRIEDPFYSRLTDTVEDHFGEGGAMCYLVRFIGTGSASAARTVSTPGAPTAGSIKSNAGTFPLEGAVPGDTLSASVDGGGVVTGTINATPATKTGAAATYAAVAASSTLSVSIDGIPGVQLITFDGTEAAQAAWHAQINGQLRGARVTNVGGQTQFTTDRMGSTAAGTINVTGSAAPVLASLGLTTGAFTNAGPNNVADVDSITAAEFDTIMEAALVGASVTLNADDSVTILSDTTGAASSIDLSGTLVAKIAGFDTDTHVGTTNTPAATILMESSVGTDLSPGTAGNNKSTKVTRNDTTVSLVAVTTAGSKTQLTVVSPNRIAIGDTLSITKGLDVQRFTVKGIAGTVLTLVAAITVPAGGYDGTESLVLETFDITVYDASGAPIFPSPFRALRTSALAGARYFVNAIGSQPRSPIKVTDLAAAVSDKRPATDSVAVNLTGGLDGAAPTANDVISVISSLPKAKEAMTVSCPGAATDFAGIDGIAVLKALEAYVERRKDLIHIATVPKGTPAIGGGGVKEWIRNTANLSSNYESVYGPWVQRLHTGTGLLTAFPPEPHIMGLLGRVHRENHFGRPPAGTQFGKLLNVLGLEYYLEEGSDEMDDIYPAGFNPILNFEGDGICVFGAQTLDATGEFGQLNVQIVLNVNKRLAKHKLRWTVFDFNNESTRSAVTRVLEATYREQKNAGILAGENDEDAFWIKCDEDNNDAVTIAKGKLVVQVGLAIERPTEFTDFSLELDTRKIDKALGIQAAGV